MSLTEALRARAPQAFGALYDEYAEPLYAYCCVVVGAEAHHALRDAFITVARHPGAVPGEDAELPVWLLGSVSGHAETAERRSDRGAEAADGGKATGDQTDPLGLAPRPANPAALDDTCTQSKRAAPVFRLRGRAPGQVGHTI
ncbi:hypothetical protein [Actinoallomurus sp. NPDC050550]|uniref:RNA polymerase sigma factor n=1 Tax=Actinoallomurus sp. NPDC050550 TaxID=3154937 RepID=UPI003405FDDC